MKELKMSGNEKWNILYSNEMKLMNKNEIWKKWKLMNDIET